MQLIFVIIALFIFLYGVKPCKWNEGYMCKEETNAIKGFFVTIVILSHANGYISLGEGGMLDRIYSLFFLCVGQMMVVPFFLYSGYGISLQFSKKGKVYVENFFRHRIIRIWIHFAIAVLFFIILNLILDIRFTLYDNLLSFTGWTSIGNSNWFIFVMLALYVISYVSMKITKHDGILHIALIWILSIMLWVLLYFSKGESWYWYDTLLAFPLGYTLYYEKDRLKRILQSLKGFLIALVIAVLGFGFFSFFRNPYSITISSLLFGMIIIVLSTRFVVGNGVLSWLGSRMFEIYIFQRIPMIILQQLGISNPLIFIALSIICTCILAEVMHRFYKKIDSLIIPS